MRGVSPAPGPAKAVNHAFGGVVQLGWVPQLVASEETRGFRLPSGAVGYGVLISLALALFVAPFACPWPDALEAVAHRIGLATQSANAPLAEYRFPLIGSTTMATAVAGAVGTILAFIAAYGLSRMAVPVLGATKKDASPGN